MGSAVIFGGTGFIGVFFARQLLVQGLADKVYLYDHEPLTVKVSTFRQNLAESDTRIIYIEGDVRQPITWKPEEDVNLIANFAAVHREPGHENHEYYQTNLLGAENVCDFAELVGCDCIIFTSSISPYGPSEDEKNESALPTPTTAYGSSKLAAEKIHQIWQAKGQAKRRLVIVRPGVVFGPGEGGNVSRLIRAVLGRYFFYMGNQDTRKAGTYVKELCNAIIWVLENQDNHGEQVSLFNMSMNPGPSIKEYVDTIGHVSGNKRFIPAIPYKMILLVAYSIDLIAKPLGIKHPFSPVRIKKLVRSNNISPNYLVKKGYCYQYTLHTALEDWKKDCPEEWK